MLRKIQLFGRRTDIYLAEPGSNLLQRLSSMLVQTNIFRPEDSMLPVWEKFPTSGQRVQFLLGESQLSGQTIEIYLVDSVSFLLE